MAIYMVTFDNPIKILSVHIFYCKKSSKTIYLLARIIVLKIIQVGFVITHVVHIKVPDNLYLLIFSVKKCLEK